MDFHDLSEQLTQALVDQLAVIDQRQAEQRARWFEQNKSGVYVDTREEYKIMGHKVTLPVLGMERPTRLDIDEIEVDVDSDLTEGRTRGLFRLMVNFFSGSADKASTLTIRIKLKQTPPAEGILALYKRASNEIKMIANQIGPEPEKEEEQK